MKRLAVIGDPVSHSRSPAMQNAALEALGLADEWRYEAIQVPAEEFDQRVREMAEGDFVGANVTIPHKERALALADDASEAARSIGAVNTLSFDAGRIVAENTDAAGVLAVAPADLAEGRALVLGAGGVARAAAWALAEQGAEVLVWNRSSGRAEQLASSLGDRVRCVEGDEARECSPALIINCTAVGMPGRDLDPFVDLPLDRDALGGVTLVDLVYAGEETRLVREAAEAGAVAVGGLESLVRQGAESLRIWTGAEPPLDVMRKAAAAA